MNFNARAVFLFSLCTAVMAVFMIGSASAQIITQPSCGVAGIKSHDGTSFGCRPPPPVGRRKGSMMHQGADYYCALNSPLRAEIGGTMECKPNTKGAGNNCTIRSGCVTLRYMHMSRTGFVTGIRQVTQGQFIGYSGDTADGKGAGYPAASGMGAHLHFEIHIDGLPVNPQFYFYAYNGRDVCNDRAAKENLQKNRVNEMNNCPWSQPYTRPMVGAYGAGAAPGVPESEIVDPETVDETDTCNVSGVE